VQSERKNNKNTKQTTTTTRQTFLSKYLSPANSNCTLFDYVSVKYKVSKLALGGSSGRQAFVY